jgi:eukaryotic-like serine/threonine-protein kinase
MDVTLSAPIGQLLDGRYLVESQLARGGMATVYLARDVRLDRAVAIKIAHPELARDREFVDRFIGEAHAVARLSSPNVVAVFDQGSTGDLNYIAMEYVPGPTLRELLTARGRLNPREALDIIERVLAGLAVAHDAGIIHRDVKPENVLLGNGTSVKVADFGLARAASGIRHTRSGLLIGTAAYLAPEQVASNSSDQRTDVYAVGVMLFEMLTGRQPHTGDTPLAVAYKHVNAVVPAPSSLHPELPPALDTLVALATSRDPELRPADARHYLHAISEVRRGMPLPPVTRQDTQPGSASYAAPGVTAPAGPMSGSPTGLTSNGSRQPGADMPEPDSPNAGAGLQPAYDSRTVQYPPVGSPAESGGHTGQGNRTMVVPVGQGPDFGGDGYPGRAHRAARGYAEPWLQRWLFSRRVLIVPAVVLAAVLVWWLAAGRYVTVPQVTGMTVSTARADLAGAGLQLVSGHARHSNTVAAGHIIVTDPASGAQIGRGGKVTVITSLGPVLVAMPSVTGEPLAQAQQAIRQAGLKAAAPTYQPSASVPANLVIATNPPAYQGQPLPNFVGQQIGDVEAQAAAGGYTINAVADTTSPEPAGTVTSQQPAAGTPISPNEVVQVAVSTGQGSQTGQTPGEVGVPDVTGMSQDQATSTLQAAGFTVQVHQGLFGSKVTSYSPTGQAPQGSTITINIGYL